MSALDAKTNPSAYWRNLRFSLTPTVPPPPDLSDGTPVYLYAVICTSEHCSEPDANVLT